MSPVAGERTRGGSAQRQGFQSAASSSRDAQRIAAAVLEVLAGVRSPAGAAQALELSLARYYQLESRAFQGLVAACEPRPVGRRSSTEQQLADVRRQLERVQREHARQQALVRAAQRTIGLAWPEPPGRVAQAGAGSKPKRVRRPSARALKAARALRADLAAPEPAAAASGGPVAAAAALPGP